MDWSDYEVEGQLSIFYLIETEKPKKKMKVLVACEESQRVCIEFRIIGHEAYSCDIQDCLYVTCLQYLRLLQWYCFE